MKKALSILAIVLTLGALGYQVANAGPGRDWGPGNSNGPAFNTATGEKWQAFKNDTADLRKQLREKRRAYFKLMQGDKVDKKAAEALWSDMFDLRTQIRAKAAAAGLQLPMRGFGRHRHHRDRRCDCGCRGPRGNGYSPAGQNGAPGPQ